MPKSARPRTDNVLTMPLLESPAALGSDRGRCSPGVRASCTANAVVRTGTMLHDVDDGLSAERELRDASRFSASENQADHENIPRSTGAGAPSR